MTSLQAIADSLQPGGAKIPPLENWHPELSGDMDMLITRDGRWIHEGDEIKRQSLVNLFATILWREGDDYFLKTPVEKWRIRVEDVPFYLVQLDVEKIDGIQRLIFRSSTGDVVVADANHPLRVKIDAATGEPSPYLSVRHGMEGRLSRNVFYQLVELAEEKAFDDHTTLVVQSHSIEFPLGNI